MRYNFDKAVDRCGTNSYKWDHLSVMFPEDQDVIPMWVADTDFQCPDEITDAIRKRASHPIYGYSGIAPATAGHVAAWEAKRNDWKVDPFWIVYSNGIVPALGIAVVAFSNPGDGIIIQSPVYYPFKEAVERNGRVAKENFLVYDGEKWRINFEDLEQKAAEETTKILILCNPHNPVGRVFTRAELETVADICIRNHVLIVSDEIHSDLIFKGNKHIPIASLSEAASMQTVTAVAPSKTFNIAGLQMSAIIAENPEIRERFVQARDHLFPFIPSLFGAVGIEAAYANAGCENYIEEVLDYVWENYEALRAGFQAHTPKLRIQKPEGTYLLWIDCGELGLSTEELEKFWVKEAKIGIEMGAVFGDNSRNYVRMNIGCTRGTINECLDRLTAAYNARNF